MTSAVFLKHPHGELRLQQDPHPLMPEGYDLTAGEVFVTRWGGVLPTVEFSKVAFKALEMLAENESQDFFEERAKLVARFMIAREKVVPATFDDTMGCWPMPLSAQHDEQGRARYPRISVRALGWTNGGAHQAAFQELRAITIPTSNGNKPPKRHPVDHLCHDHACCNPYHLYFVTHEENTARGATVRSQKRQPQLFQPAKGNINVTDLLKYPEYEAVEKEVEQ